MYIEACFYIMETKQFLELLKRNRLGKATAEEREFLRTYYNLFELEPDVLDEMKAEERDAIKGRIENRLTAEISKGNKAGKVVPMWKRGIAAAAAVAAIVVSVYFFSYRSEILKQVQDDVVYKDDVVPGRNRATLTLGDGRVIDLSDGKTGVVIGEDKLAYNDGSLVQDSSGSHFSGSLKGDQKNTGPVRAPSLGAKALLTASTPRGGTYQIVLPDGTKVWLNADSKLVFPSSFSRGKQRVVRLSGEGYFEVAKVFVKSSNPLSLKGSLQGGENRNLRVPFIVITDKQEVTVLGTHFNISAYGDERDVRTTLLEGSVRVSKVVPPGTGEIAAARSGRPRNKVVLKPNQQAVVSGANRIAVKEVDTKTAVAWKNNEFMFENERIETIMRMVERWYDVEVVYQGEMPEDKFLGSVSRFDKVSKVLKLLEATGRIHFRIEGRKIYVFR
jgi:transmembrane sensor